MRGLAALLLLAACSSPTPAAKTATVATTTADAGARVDDAVSPAPVAPTGIWGVGDVVIATGPGRILRSEDRGAHWTESEGPGDQPVVWGASVDDVYVAGRDVAHSTDGGRTWQRAAATLPGSVTGIWGTPDGGAVWVVGGSSNGPPFIAVSRDRGAKWSVLRHSVPVAGLYDVAGPPDGKGVYFFGKRNVPNGTAALVFRANDDGSMDRLSAPTQGLEEDWIRKACFTSSGALAVATAYGVHVSRDRGATWRLGSDVGTDVLSLACSGKRVVAGARNRKFRISDDDGFVFKPSEIGSALGDVAITAAYVAPNLEVFVGAESSAKGTGGGGTLIRRAATR